MATGNGYDNGNNNATMTAAKMQQQRQQLDYIDDHYNATIDVTIMMGSNRRDNATRASTIKTMG